METFNMWLNNELKKRDWLAADLARKAKLGKSTITRILNGGRDAGPEVCVAIAEALGEPPEKVFRLAGLLPELSQEDATLRELMEYARTLTRDQRKVVLRFAWFNKSDVPPAPISPPLVIHEQPATYTVPPEVSMPGPEDIAEITLGLDEFGRRMVYDMARWLLADQVDRRDSSSQRRKLKITREEMIAYLETLSSGERAALVQETAANRLARFVSMEQSHLPSLEPEQNEPEPHSNGPANHPEIAEENQR
jgi:transcriptional regulator with XRE-family HTH domain